MTESVVDEPLLARLQEATRSFEARRFSATAAIVEALPGQGGPLGRSLSLAARGLILEEARQGAEAAALMEHAHMIGVALPALLEELTRYFQRHGRGVPAHHAFLMRELCHPQVATEVIAGLSRLEQVRFAPWAMRALPAQGKQLTYRFAPFKAAMTERLGPDGAAMILAAVSDGGSSRRAAYRPLIALIDYARRHGLDYDEVIAGGSARDTPTPVWNGPAGPPQARHARAVFACVLEDVIVCPGSNVLLARDGALLDFQGDELARRPHDLSVDPIIVAAAEDEVLILEPSSATALPEIPEAIWMTGVHARAFGHWIMEFLPRAWALMERPGFRDVPILVDQGMPAQHVEALQLFAGESHPVIMLAPHERVTVARLWVASSLSYLPVGPRPIPGRRVRNGLDDEGFRTLLSRVGPILDGIDSTDAPSHLYLSRKATQHRRLANATDVEATLARHGFVARDFGELPFREQLRLIRGADHIIAAGGSAVLTTIFGRQGLHVGVLMPPALNDVGWLTQTCRALSQHLTALVGRIDIEHPTYRWMSDYEIDVEALQGYLEAASPPVRPTEAAR